MSDNHLNNLMRHNYRQLTADELAQMVGVKDAGLAFVRMLHAVGGTGTGPAQASRELSMAQTKIEEAVMWAVKHVTR